MAEIDIKKSAENIAEWLTNYFEQFVRLLATPRLAMRTEFLSQVSSKERFQHALVYSAISILLGICLAKFMGLPNAPSEVNPQTAASVLILWIISAALLHPFLRLFRGKGTLQDTVVVFLCVISSLHLLFIPVLTVAGRVLTDTKVTLSYEYVIYFGVPSSRDGSGESWGRGLTSASGSNWREHLVGKQTETFIKEKQPRRNTTILTPLSLSNYSSPDAVPMTPEQRSRIPASSASLRPPIRTEEPVVREGVGDILLLIWLIYYLVNAAYLAAGLSIAHHRNVFLLFALAVLGPVILVVLAITVLLTYFFVT